MSIEAVHFLHELKGPLSEVLITCIAIGIGGPGGGGMTPLPN